MLRATWNWIIGLICIFCVAVIWIGASFVVQSVVDSGISPFLIAYICNSLFVVYIPIVEFFWWVKQLLTARAESRTRKGSKAQQVLTNAEKAKLLEGGSGSDSERTTGIARVDQDTAQVTQEVTLEISSDEDNENCKESLQARRLLSRKETAKISAIICPVWFLAQFTFNLSLKYTTVTSNTVLSSTSTLFTFIASVAVLGEPFTVLKIVGVVLCMAGSATVALGDSESFTKESAPHPVLGDVICILSAMLYACYTSLIRKKFPDENSATEQVSMALFLGYLGLFNALIFSPIVLLLHFTGLEPIHRLTTTQFSLIIGKGMLDNVLSDFLWAKAVLLTTATVATAGLTLQVPIAAVVDSLRGHPPGRLNVVGAVAVLAGFFGINQPEKSCCSPAGRTLLSTTEEESLPKEKQLDDAIVAIKNENQVRVDHDST